MAAMGSFRASWAALAIAAAALSSPALAADPNKVFRYAFEIAETSFDPHRISDVYSNIVNQGMFDAPLTYDYLALPVKLKPETREKMEKDFAAKQCGAARCSRRPLRRRVPRPQSISQLHVTARTIPASTSKVSVSLPGCCGRSE